MRKAKFKNVITPSVQYLRDCGKLLLDSHEMARFLGVPP
jgi:hypothetical protein